MKKILLSFFIFLSLALSAAADDLEDRVYYFGIFQPQAGPYVAPRTGPNFHDVWNFVKDFQDLPEDAQNSLRFQAEGDEEKSREFMKVAIQKNSRNYGVRLAATQWALRAGEMKIAQEQAKAALTLAPDSTEVQFVRGIVAMHQRDFAEAEKIFKKIHDDYPSHITAIHYLALALCEQNDPVKLRKSEEYAQLNVRMKDAPPEAFAAMGWVLYKEDRFAAANEFLQEAVRTADGEVSSDIKYYIAALKMKSNNSDTRKEAKEILTEILESKMPFYKRADAEKLHEIGF